MAQIVAERGSFAAAARGLQVDPSSISRAIAGIEAELGFRLFQRSTRHLAATEEGHAYLARITPLLDEIDQAGQRAREQSDRPSGTMRLSASIAFGQECLLPALAGLRRAHPGLSFELVLSDQMLDLIEHGIDLAIRLAPGPSGDVISTRLRATRYHVCASPDYLADHGALSDPGDLTHRDCLRLALPEHRTRWRFRRADQADVEVPVAGSLIISNPLVLREAARQGMGPALLADWLVAGDLATGRLVDLFPHHQATATEFDTGAWALYPSRAYMPAKLRVTLDHLRATLSQSPLPSDEPDDHTDPTR